MNGDHDSFINHEFDRKVRETAYFLWEQAGRPWGREQEFWFVALDRCLREREADELLRNSHPAPPVGRTFRGAKNGISAAKANS